MSGRAAPWRNKPSQALQQLLDQLNPQASSSNGSTGSSHEPSSSSSSSSSCWYVLQRLGPACFVVGPDQGDSKYKVTLGNVPTCSCCSSNAPADREPCIHLLFILVRVMRLAPNNPLLWQSALTDRELQQVLDGTSSRQNNSSTAAAHQHHSRAGSSSSKTEAGVQRRTVEQDEPCPICYEPLTAVDTAWLVWCSNSCGKNIHGRCMRVWSDHQTKTLHQELSCPLCRCPWGALNWSPPPAPASSSNRTTAGSGKGLHRGVDCGACHQGPIEGCRYRCLGCARFDLCGACFSTGQHLQHSFVCRTTPTAPEQLAERPMHAAGLQCSCITHTSIGSRCSSSSSPAFADADAAVAAASHAGGQFCDVNRGPALQPAAGALTADAGAVGPHLIGQQGSSSSSRQTSSSGSSRRNSNSGSGFKSSGQLQPAHRHLPTAPPETDVGQFVVTSAAAEASSASASVTAGHQLHSRCPAAAARQTSFGSKAHAAAVRGNSNPPAAAVAAAACRELQCLTVSGLGAAAAAATGCHCAGQLPGSSQQEVEYSAAACGRPAGMMGRCHSSISGSSSSSSSSGGGALPGKNVQGTLSRSSSGAARQLHNSMAPFKSQGAGCQPQQGAAGTMPCDLQLCGRGASETATGQLQAGCALPSCVDGSSSGRHSKAGSRQGSEGSIESRRVAKGRLVGGSIGIAGTPASRNATTCHHPDLAMMGVACQHQP